MARLWPNHPEREAELKAKVRVTMHFDIELPIETGMTEHSGLDVQLMHFRKEVMNDPLDILLEYQVNPTITQFEYRGEVE